MKEAFENTWHGISLDSISDGDRSKLPDSNFYQRFYQEFYKRHSGWKDLAPNWSAHKLHVARFLKARLPAKGKVLSVGCGLGIIEKFLLEDGINMLEIQEVSADPLRWVKPLFANDAVHIGLFPDCLDSSKKYNYIYFSGVDYCFNQQEWIDILKAVRERLDDNGNCLVITTTCHLSDYSWSEICLKIKARIKHLLSFFGLYDLGQMMGWRRSREDFREAMTKAGFESLADGFLEKDALTSRTYWIEGGVR